MPKPVKKPVRKLKTPLKPKRPADPVLAAGSMLAEHIARVQEAPAEAPLSFETQYKAHMAKLGKKGGDVSGERRMQMPLEVRRRVASIAARAMWAKRKAAKKR